MPTKPNSVRLPNYIKPVRYKILLTPDLEGFKFDGEEEIEIEISKKTDEVLLHSAEIEITEAQVTGVVNDVAEITYIKKHEIAKLKFNQSLAVGKTFLRLKFTGILNDKMRGFYRSKYTHEGKTYHMGVTQFESTDARRAFPCFDEPDKKAIFEVSLRIPSDRTAISNTVETEILEHEGGFKTIKFAPSPIMSTYLLAFIVGHFEYLEKQTESGVLVRVLTTPGKKMQSEFALDFAVKTVSFFEDYFGIAYPLPSLDLIAIPDFASGAMENWGAITYRESLLLVDRMHSSIQNKQWVALVIAHEIAHQWFGNLVTMEWWTHLWLNEGFASYMEYVAVDSIFPEWDIWSQFVFIEQSKGLELDGLASTHPIEVEVNDPGEISEIFDAVSYSKGASIIRMLAEYLGEKDFKKGLTVYLKKYSYGNATTEDLWKSWEEASGKPVRKIMKDWTGKPGYPLVSIEEKEDDYVITQERFFASSHQKSDEKFSWIIPLSMVSYKNKKPKFVLIKNKHLTIPQIKGDSWIKLNVKETSFVRINYSPYLLSLLRAPIEERDEALLPEDKFGIIRDGFALSQSGKNLTDEALKLALAYKGETDYVVWAQISSELLKLKNLFYGAPFYENFKRFVVEVFIEVAAKLGWEAKKDEPHLQTLLRSTVLYALGANGHEPTINKALEIFRNYTDKGIAVDSDLRGVIYALVAENSGLKVFEKFIEMYKKETLEEEKGRLLRAMCSFKDPKILEKTLEFSFSEDMRPQDSFKSIGLVWSNPFGRGLAWKFLKKNWDDLSKKYAGGHMLTRFVSPAENFTTSSEAEGVKRFFSDKNTDGVKLTLAQAIEQIYSNEAWLKRDSHKLSEFLKNF